MTDLYFAYGSNLDRDDWAAFCLPRGFDPDGLRPVCPAVLRGEALVFDYRSIRRGGGVLNIRSTPGSTIDGYVFEILDRDWRALDAKEGHPHVYRREQITAHDMAGQPMSVETYRVVAARRIGFCPPTAQYLDICRAGRERYGLAVVPLDAAAGGAQDDAPAPAEADGG